jgi:HK97 family phage prohead protease
VETRDFNLKIKAAGEADGKGTFSGLAATYDVDQGGDRIIPGAFTMTLQSSKGTFPLLWQHQSDNPIGSVKCTETSSGLAVEGSILLSVPAGQQAYDFIKAGIIKGLSIGYTTVKEGFDNGVRLLKEVKLFEVSAVTFPMNEGALIASVKNMKAMSDSDRGKHLKSIDEHRRAIDRHQRGMRENMKALFGDEMFNDDDGAGDDTDLLDEELTDDESKELLAEMRKMMALAGD